MKGVRGPWEHSTQSASPSFPIPSSQSSPVCPAASVLANIFPWAASLTGPFPRGALLPGSVSLPPCPGLCCSADGRAAHPGQAYALVWVPGAGCVAAGAECLMEPCGMRSYYPSHHRCVGMGTDHSKTCAAPWCWPGRAGVHRYFKVSMFHGLLALHRSLTVLFSALHRVVLPHTVPRPGLWPVELEAGSDALSPLQHLPGSRAASRLTSPGRHPHLGAGGSWVSPVVVPGAALTASTPCKLGAAAFLLLYPTSS